MTWFENLRKWFEDTWKAYFDYRQTKTEENLKKWEERGITLDMIEEAKKPVSDIISEAVIYDVPAELTPTETDINKLIEEANLVNASHLGVASAMVAAETASAGLVDYTLSEFMDVPWMQAMRDMARDTYKAQYQIAVNPILKRYWLKKYQPLRASPDLYGIARQKDWIEDEEYYTKMQEHGFSADEAKWYYWAAERPPNLETILMLDRRGLITDEYYEKLYKSLLTQGWIIPALKELKWQYPEPYRLAEQVMVGAIDEPEYYEAMGKIGFNWNWADKWRWGMHRPPTLEVLSSLKWRGKINEETFVSGLKQSGMQHWYAEQMPELLKVIPSIGDLRTMAVREAFYEEGEPLPREEQWKQFTSWAAKQGLSADWANRYKRAGYRRMDVGSAQEYWLLLRDEPELFKDFLYIADYHPLDHDMLHETSFHPPTIRELGYGYDMAVYNRDDIVRFRRWGGLTVDDAEKSADALIKYRTQAEINAVAREWLWLFAHERIPEKAFREELSKLGFRVEFIELWIQRGKLQIERYRKGTITEASRIIAASEAKYAFQYLGATEEWYRNRLAALDWTDDRIDLAVERAIYELMPEPVEPIEPKELTRGDIRNLYDMRVFSRPQIQAAYEEMGYTAEVAEQLSISTMLSVDFPDIRARYRNAWISSEELLQEIVNLGVDVDRAITLTETVVKNEAAARFEKERDLTKSEIKKGYMEEVLSWEEAVALLMDIGYEDWEAEYILYLEVVKAAGDPESYWEMKRVTSKYKQAAGYAEVKIPDEVIMLDRRRRILQKELKKLRAAKASTEQITEKEKEYGEIKARLKTVLAKLKLV